MAEHLQNRVRFARRRAGLSQQMLAEQTGVSRQTIISLEKGDYDPSVLLAIRISRALGLRVEQLFYPVDGRQNAENQNER